jgi:hypothetical protein
MQKEYCNYSQNATNTISPAYLFEFRTFSELCFTMIISKAKGQSLKETSTNLSKEYFSHMWLLQIVHIYWHPLVGGEEINWGLYRSCVLKITVSWHVAPCRLVYVYKHFRGL